MTDSDSVSLKRIAYAELKREQLTLEGDDLGVVSDYLIKQTKEALLANPNYDDDSKTVLNVVYYDGVIVGRHMLMPTRIKLGDRSILAQTGGGHEIHEDFQGKGLGTGVVKDAIMNSEYPMYIGQLYSSGAISILRKMDLCIFEKPLYNKYLKTRSVLAAKGLKGAPLKLCACLGDALLGFRELPIKLKKRSLNRDYSVRKEETVPEWASSMAIDDGHKYMEIHDRAWLQWNLDHVFSNNPRDRNSFFAVYDRADSPVGFFMTKERFEENRKGVYKNLIRGTVVEWGTRDERVLNEADLNYLALSTFGHDVDKVNTVISSSGIDESIVRLGFEYRGMYQMTLKSSSQHDDDLIDQEQWRIRYGGCNTILV